MADTDQSPPRQTEPIVRTVASITREGCDPQTHAYDDPSIDAKEFLLRAMRSKHLPLSQRIKAARDVATYFVLPPPRPVTAVTPLALLGMNSAPRTPSRSTAKHSHFLEFAQVAIPHNQRPQALQILRRIPIPPI